MLNIFNIHIFLNYNLIVQSTTCASLNHIVVVVAVVLMGLCNYFLAHVTTVACESGDHIKPKIIIYCRYMTWVSAN